MTRAALLALLLAACGHADEPPARPTTRTIPDAPTICAVAVEGHKLTYACAEKW